jgi:methylmalonyl-CoA mutase N-terminal domain/subunit
MSEELEEISFSSEEFDKVITDIIEGILVPKTYDEKEAQKWINDINEAVMAKLIDMQRPFKYAINTMIMQRKGANVAVSHNNFWDSAFDQSIMVIWPK